MTPPRPNRLLIGLPAFNEAASIDKVLASIPCEVAGFDVVDRVVVDDGCTDSTHEKVAAAQVLCLVHKRNLGLGAAFRTLVEYAIENGYDALITIDADGQFDPTDIHRLASALQLEGADMVTISRFHPQSSVINMPRVKRWGNGMVSRVVSQMIGQSFCDVSCGFRCYGREALLQLTPQGNFTYTQEVFLDLAAKRMKIVEIPATVHYFSDRVSKQASSLWHYGTRAGMILLRGYRDYFPLRFFWSLSLACLVPALIMAAVFFGHFLETGRFTGYLFAGFSAAFFSAMSLIFFVLGLVTDMLDRIRRNQEKIIQLLRSR